MNIGDVVAEEAAAGEPDQWLGRAPDAIADVDGNPEIERPGTAELVFGYVEAGELRPRAAKAMVSSWSFEAK
jgi:hypothetical protein